PDKGAFSSFGSHSQSLRREKSDKTGVTNNVTPSCPSKRGAPLPLRNPCLGAARLPGAAGPDTATGEFGQLAGSPRILFADSDRRTNRPRGCDAAPESQDVRMADVTVDDVDREIVAGIARAALRVESQIPCPVKTGPCGCRSRNAEVDRGDQTEN